MNQDIMDQIPTLVKYCSVLEDSIIDISNRWIHYPMVEDVLSKYEIDAVYFKNEYAFKVLEYYFGVIKNINEIGNYLPPQIR